MILPQFWRSSGIERKIWFASHTSRLFIRKKFQTVDGRWSIKLWPLPKGKNPFIKWQLYRPRGSSVLWFLCHSLFRFLIKIFGLLRFALKILLLFISTGYPSTLRHRADKDNKGSVDKSVTENSKYLRMRQNMEDNMNSILLSYFTMLVTECGY